MRAWASRTSRGAASSTARSATTGSASSHCRSHTEGGYAASQMTGAVARFLASTAVAAVLCGCGSVYNKASNVAWTPDTPVDTISGADVMGENSIVLAFSGGGLRAAAFTHGTLLAFQGIPTPDGYLLDTVPFITSAPGS